MRATPKVSAQQRRVIESGRVKLIGFDMANRPVVRGKPSQWAKSEQEWALTRQGDAIDVTPPVRTTSR